MKVLKLFFQDESLSYSFFFKSFVFLHRFLKTLLTWFNMVLCCTRFIVEHLCVYISMRLKYLAFASGLRCVKGVYSLTSVVNSFDLDIYKQFGSSMKNTFLFVQS